MEDMNNHFSKIADKYRELRTTDMEPILYIKKQLQNFSKIEAADIGCGDGRYDLALFKLFNGRLYLHCLDVNQKMLNNLNVYLTNQGIKNFRTIKASAEKLPLESKTLDCIFTFNAIHHFNLFSFLKQTANVLKDKGYLFIYTRLKGQNKNNIWGKYFPLFNEKETRLYESSEILKMFEKIPGLQLNTVKSFKFERISEIDEVLRQVKSHHYSTFSLYTPEEFDQSLEKFKQNIHQYFNGSKKISWFDENTLFECHYNPNMA